jgi:hypothetical protein
MSKPSEPVTVEINGTDVSAKLHVMEKNGELFAESKGFIKAFADKGQPDQGRWFDCELLLEGQEMRVSSPPVGDVLFTLHNLAGYIERPGALTVYMRSYVHNYLGVPYVPMLAFCGALGKWVMKSKLP